METPHHQSVDSIQGNKKSRLTKRTIDSISPDTESPQPPSFEDVTMAEEFIKEYPPHPVPSKSSYREKLVGNDQLKFNEEIQEDLEKIKIVGSSKEVPFPQIVIEEDLMEEIRKDWEGAIILKFTSKQWIFHILRSKLDNLWKLRGCFELTDLGHGAYIIKVEDEEARDNILTNGPWMVAGNFITIRKWFPDMKASTDKITTAITWVRIPELAVEYYRKNIIHKIASSLGDPLKIDRQTYCATRGRFARFCLQIDMEKPLERAVMINGTVYPVIYEIVPVLCYDCGHVGHRKDACPSNMPPAAINVDMDTSEVTKPKRTLVEEKIASEGFGDWMLVSRNKKKLPLSSNKKAGDLVQGNKPMTAGSQLHPLGNSAKGLRETGSANQQKGKDSMSAPSLFPTNPVNITFKAGTSTTLEEQGSGNIKGWYWTRTQSWKWRMSWKKNLFLF